MSSARKGGPSAAVRIRVMKRDRFRCTYCGVPGTDAELEVDHIIAVSRGGSHHMSNLTTACRKCNQSKGDRDAPEKDSGKVTQTIWSRRCSVAGCRDSHVALGLCDKHYKAQARRATPPPPPLPRAEYFPLIQCGLLRSEVDFSKHVVRLFLPDSECTDMTGAIKYAKELDADVLSVFTFSAARRDTSYHKEGDKWIAVTGEGVRMTPDEGRLSGNEK